MFRLTDQNIQSSGHSSKRKLDPVRDPSTFPSHHLLHQPLILTLRCTGEIYKSARTSTDGASRHARVEDEPSQQDNDDDEAGPELPPNDDGDYGPDMPPDDEEGGRFFGGGLEGVSKS